MKTHSASITKSSQLVLLHSDKCCSVAYNVVVIIGTRSIGMGGAEGVLGSEWGEI